MPKPALTPTWGTDKSNDTEPPSLLKASGHPLNSPLVSSYENWLKRTLCEWVGWLAARERTIELHHSAFVASDGSTSIAQHTTGGYLTLAGFGVAMATVALPVGSTLHEVTARYDRDGAGTVTPKLRRVDLVTGTPEDVAAGSADSSSTGIQATPIDAGDHVVADGYAYFVELSLSSASNRLYGARVEYAEGDA